MHSLSLFQLFRSSLRFHCSPFLSFLPPSFSLLYRRKTKICIAIRGGKSERSRFHVSPFHNPDGLNRSLLSDPSPHEETSESTIPKIGSIFIELPSPGELNYIIIIAIVCEFCNKFVLSSVLTGCSYYGHVVRLLTSFEFWRAFHCRSDE